MGTISVGLPKNGYPQFLGSLFLVRMSALGHKQTLITRLKKVR
jgi:hypothetical protein